MDVLLAIANPADRAFLDRILRARGHAVTACATADEALEARRRGAHRLVLVGSNLPGGGASSICRRLRAGQEPCFVLAVADEGAAASCERLLEAGASDVLLASLDERVAASRIAVAEERVRQSDATRSALREHDERVRQALAVADLGRSALESADLDAFLEHAVRTIAKVLRVELVKVLEATQDRRTLRLRAGVGWKEGLVGRATMSAETGSQAGFALRSDEPVVVDDLRKEKRFRGATLLHQHGVTSGVSVPIRGRPHGYGVLGAHTRERRAFTTDEVVFLRSAANLIAAAVGRARLEEHVIESEERARKVLESALDAVVAIDASERVIGWNGRAEEIFGWRREDAVGRRLAELVIPERERAAHRAGLARFLETGEGPFLQRRLAVTAQRKDGREFPAELSVTPVRVGGAFTFYAFVRDVSDARRAEEALRTSERFCRRLAEATPHAIFVFDVLDRRLDYASDRSESVVGWTPEALLAKGAAGVEELVHPDDRAKVPEMLHAWAAAADDDVVTTELRVGASGAWRIVRAHVRPFARAADGRVRQVVGTVEDVSLSRREEEERRALATRVQGAQKMESLGVLAGGIAHDFNNLLTSILGNAGLALVRMRPSSPARPFVDQIQRAARRAADLTEQLLAYAGKGRYVVEPVEFASLVEEMTDLLRTVVAKDVRLVYRFGAGVPAVMGDATQLRQVVMNLITNASEACVGKGGDVVVSTFRVEVGPGDVVGIGSGEPLAPGGYVLLQVEDTGSGMDEPTLAKIFDPFFTTKMTGRGLGLAGVLGIVRSHHGAIRVRTELGRGSRFQVYLPVAERADTPTSAVVRASRWRGSGTVLVVDDEEDVRNVAVAMLRDAGFDTVEASDGAEALERFREHRDRVVLVVLDLTMPRLDGVATLAALRAISPAAKVLVSSGYAEEEAMARFDSKAGPDGFLRKPYLLDEFRATVRKLVGARNGTA
jgi:PAS domain S-box-containing protein